MAAAFEQGQQDGDALAMPLRDATKRRAYERKRKRLKRLAQFESLPEPERSKAMARLRGPYTIDYGRRQYW